MKRFLIALAFVLSQAAHASGEPMTAGTVQAACKAVRSGSTQMTDLATCIQLNGFVFGYLAGAKHGELAMLIHDDAALATTKGIADVRQRIGRVYPFASCISSDAAMQQVTDVFILYVDEHPETKSQPYPAVFKEAIESHYCP